MFKTYNNVYKVEVFYPDRDVKPSLDIQSFEVGIVHCMSWECYVGNIKHHIGPDGEYWSGEFNPDGNIEKPLYLVVAPQPEPYGRRPVYQIEEWLRDCFEVYIKSKLRGGNMTGGTEFPLQGIPV